VYEDSTTDSENTTGAKLDWQMGRKPRPPVTSGCVGISASGSRETRNRKTPQSVPRHTHRSARNQKRGWLTVRYHQPAKERRSSAPATAHPRWKSRSDAKERAKEAIKRQASARLLSSHRIAARADFSKAGRLPTPTRCESRNWRAAWAMRPSI